MNPPMTGLSYTSHPAERGARHTTMRAATPLFSIEAKPHTLVENLLQPWRGGVLEVNANETNFDFIGDIHGCCDELESLLTQLGYTISWIDDAHQRHPVVHGPENRKIVFLGDYVDRGPRIGDTLRLVQAIVENNLGYAVIGNHELRLLRFLGGLAVEARPGLKITIEQFHNETGSELLSWANFLTHLPSRILLCDGALVASHTGFENVLDPAIDDDYHLAAIRGRRACAVDEATTPDPLSTAEQYVCEPSTSWTSTYQNTARVIFGHYRIDQAMWLSQTICLDTACVYGGRLTALRWPENVFVAVECPLRMRLRANRHAPRCTAYTRFIRRCTRPSRRHASTRPNLR